MKKIELYACEVCGTQYAERQRCKECEGSHKKPLEIVGANYLSLGQNGKGYPHKIRVKMSDGQLVEYRR